MMEKLEVDMEADASRRSVRHSTGFILGGDYLAGGKEDI
jgi:hypothetical protein